MAIIFRWGETTTEKITSPDARKKTTIDHPSSYTRHVRVPGMQVMGVVNGANLRSRRGGLCCCVVDYKMSWRHGQHDKSAKIKALVMISHSLLSVLCSSVMFATPYLTIIYATR